MGKSFLKFRLIRSLSRNLWPTRSLTPKQRLTLSKLKKKKLSPFGIEMMERRKISALYGGISRTYEKKLIKKAKKYPGKLGYNFLLFLEQRLDSIVFRMNICSTFRAARQLVLHQKVYVNHQCVNIPSYQVQPGDLIRIAPHDSEIFQTLFLHALSFVTKHSSKVLPRKPFHLEINYKTLQAIYLYPPQILFYPCSIFLFQEKLTSSEFIKKISPRHSKKSFECPKLKNFLNTVTS